MSRNNLFTTFTVNVKGATFNNTPDLKVDDLDFMFFIFKDNQSYLFIRMDKETDRKKFQRTGKYFN